MTYRSSDSSCKSCCSQPQSRLNHQIKCAPKDEGCPVLDESGSVCGEKESLNVFLDFKKFYEDSLKNLERTPGGKTTLRKLTPFQRLIDYLWEQNAMLIETVGELEEEATLKLSALQDKLNKSCQKIDDYQQDINSLITIIHRFCKKGILDPEGVEFKTLCPAFIYGPCENSFTECEDTDCMDQPKVTNRDMSINCNDFGISEASDNLKCDNCNSSIKLSKMLECKVICKNSGSVKSQSCSSDKTPSTKSKSSHLDPCCETSCLCMNNDKENKSVTWVPEKRPKCPSNYERDNYHCDCSSYLK